MNTFLPVAHLRSWPENYIQKVWLVQDAVAERDWLAAEEIAARFAGAPTDAVRGVANQLVQAGFFERDGSRYRSRSD